MNKRNRKPKFYIKNGNGLIVSRDVLEKLMQDILKKRIPFRFRPKGNSMAPNLLSGDIITIFPINKPLNPGEIGVFFDNFNKRAFVHRMIKAEVDGYIFKGDANSVPDEIVPFNNVLGVVKIVERNGKKIHLHNGFSAKIAVLFNKFNFFRFYVKLLRFQKRIIQKL